MYVDIHTHSLTHDPEIEEVHILDSSIPVEVSIPGAKRFCYGLHPWKISEVEDNFYKSQLKTAMQSPVFFGLGEIGLDRARMENWEEQIKAFNTQLDIARNFRIGLIQIHCVKAYSDMLPELKKLSQNVVVILHDFNGNLETYKQFSSIENCYFSFGAKLFNSDTKAAKSFPHIPLERIFLETDDQLDKSIFDIYEQASKLRKMEQDDLKSALYANFTRIS